MENINDTNISALQHEITLLKRDKDLLLKALYLAGKYARENPPSEIPDSEDYCIMLIGGMKRDPEGIEYAVYWLDQVEIQENKRHLAAGGKT